MSRGMIGKLVRRLYGSWGGSGPREGVLSDEDRKWAKETAVQIVAEARAAEQRCEDDARRRAGALLRGYVRGGAGVVEAYLSAVHQAATTGDRRYLAALEDQARVSGDRLFQRVVSDAVAAAPQDGGSAHLSEGWPDLPEQILRVRELFDEVSTAVREDPSLLFDLVKNAAEDPLLERVIEVLVTGDRALESLVEAAREAVAAAA